MSDRSTSIERKRDRDRRHHRHSDRAVAERGREKQSAGRSRSRSRDRNRRRSRSRSTERRHSSHEKRRHSSRERRHERSGSRGQPSRKHPRRDRSRSRSMERPKREPPPSSEDERSGSRKFVRREPPPGGWDKPSWEPSGALNKEVKKELGDVDGKPSDSKDKEEQEREKPSFEPSGKLAQDTNTFKGVLIKYNEPPEAKVPKLRWRMYPFKGDDDLPVIYIHRQSAYLVGRDRKIADFPVDHPSCSKQHAVLQYRSLPFEREDGSKGRRTRPYLLDLGSANGTYLNGQRIDSQRYYELKENDVLKFGFSSREYVMLHEQSLQGNETDTSEEDEDELGNVLDQTGAEERIAKAEEDDLF